MLVFSPRAGRWPLARTIAIISALTATVVLGACSDETTAPSRVLEAVPHGVQAETAAPNPEQFETKVELTILDKRVSFNKSTGYAVVRVAVSCSAYEIFDVVLEMQQTLKNGNAPLTASGSTTREDVDCTTGSASFSLLIAPVGSPFETGNATVTARIANYEPWVIPTEARRQVRVTAQ